MPHSFAVIPCLRYDNALAAIAFLRDAFGFTEHLVVPDGNGGITHAQLTLGQGMVMLGSASNPPIADWLTAARLGGVSGCIHVMVPDADAHHATAAAHGATILEAPSDQDYGGRNYLARDPEGNLWSFGTYDPWASPGAPPA
jgi:uncharacterized glyoxalase superfamily protein PhnB